MKLYKRIFQQSWAQASVSALVSGYLRFVNLTSRWEMRRYDIPQSLIDQKQPFIICFWHGRLVPSILAWRFSATLHILSTPHRDGQIAAKTYNRFGVQTIWGSTKKGGSEAARTIIRTLKAGGVSGITPDGPKGPRQRMQKSSLDMARMAGAVLVPFAPSITRVKWLRSWDRMIVPLPFARGTFAFGEPMEIPRKASEEEYEALRQEFENRMNALLIEVDQACNQETPEPAEIKVESGS